MATFKAEFKELAAELFSDEFADFQRELVIKKDVGYNPITDTDTKFTATTGAIPLTLKDVEQVFSNVTASDIYLFTLNEAPVPADFDASYYCEYDSGEYAISEVEADPADAGYFIRIVI